MPGRVGPQGRAREEQAEGEEGEESCREALSGGMTIF